MPSTGGNNSGSHAQPCLHFNAMSAMEQELLAWLKTPCRAAMHGFGSLTCLHRQR